MNINDIRKLKWDYIRDWSSLPKTLKGRFGIHFVSKSDIDIFITHYTKNLARKLCVDYNDLDKLISEENRAFYSLLENVYTTSDGYTPNDKNLLSLQAFFKVPYLSNFVTNPVDELLCDFEKLNDIQKTEVLSKLNLISINITKSRISIE